MNGKLLLRSRCSKFLNLVRLRCYEVAFVVPGYGKTVERCYVAGDVNKWIAPKLC